MKSILILSLLLLSFTAYAEKHVPVRKPSSDQLLQFSLEVHYGDKVSTFVIDRQQNSGTLYFANSEGFKKKAAISEEDLSFLIERAMSVRNDHSASRQCPRNSVKMLLVLKSGPAEPIDSCIQRGSVANQQVARLLGLISLLM